MITSPFYTAVQAWQPCRLWESSPSHPSISVDQGTCCVLYVYLFIVYFCMYMCILCS